MDYPIFRITRGFAEGRAMTSQQRTASTFDPEPFVVSTRLRRGSPPLVLEEAAFARNEAQLLSLLRSGSIRVEVKQSETDDWDFLSPPSAGKFDPASLKSKSTVSTITKKLIEEAEDAPKAPEPPSVIVEEEAEEEPEIESSEPEVEPEPEPEAPAEPKKGASRRRRSR